MTEVTRILTRIEQGESAATDQLLPLVYDELRQLASIKLAREGPGQTLQPTALVHEAYLRLVKGDSSQRFSSRQHFFGAAAQAMRRILVDRAREKLSIKRGGSKVTLDVEFHEPECALPEEVIAVHDALDDLSAEDELLAELVKLHYFASFSIEDAAEILGLSRATAYRMWTYARAWLRSALQEDRD